MIVEHDVTHFQADQILDSVNVWPIHKLCQWNVSQLESYHLDNIWRSCWTSSNTKRCFFSFVEEMAISEECRIQPKTTTLQKLHTFVNCNRLFWQCAKKSVTFTFFLGSSEWQPRASTALAEMGGFSYRHSFTSNTRSTLPDLIIIHPCRKWHGSQVCRCRLKQTCLTLGFSSALKMKGKGTNKN